MRIILTYIIFLAVFLSCKERIWDNPFDPYCPKDLYTPGNLNARQMGYEIKLTWEQSNDKISGFILYRNLSDGKWDKKAMLSKEILNWSDNNFEGGKKYGYKLVAYAGTNESNEQVVYIMPVLAPVLTTSAAASVTSNSAITSGNISSDGGAPVTARGFCYSTSQNPDISGNKITSGTGTGSFNGTLSGLMGGTTYYVRAFATNSYGTTYGNQVSFTTSPGLAKVSTNLITTFTDITANMGGYIFSDGGLSVTERGVCYSTSQNPTVNNNKVIMGNGPGDFNQTIINLTKNTTYYTRAYAVNSMGTAYGNQVSFKTDNPLTDADGNTYKTIIIGDLVWMAENLKTTKYQDGSSIQYVTDGAEWAGLTSGAYCYFSNSASNGTIYGGLYNFYAVSDSRNICPAGWHVPSDSEWNALKDFLGGEDVAGGKMKEPGTSHWVSPNTGADNSSGFTAYAGSWRGGDGAFYYYVRQAGWWWSSTATNSDNAWFYYITSGSAGLNKSSTDPYFRKKAGCSVRCIKNLIGYTM